MGMNVRYEWTVNAYRPHTLTLDCWCVNKTLIRNDGKPDPKWVNCSMAYFFPYNKETKTYDVY